MSDHPFEDSAQTTGVSDLVYDLASTMTNLLEGIAAMEQYRQDAADEGDSEAQALFDRIAARSREEVQEVRRLLAVHLSRSVGAQ